MPGHRAWSVAGSVSVSNCFLKQQVVYEGAPITAPLLHTRHVSNPEHPGICLSPTTNSSRGFYSAPQLRASLAPCTPLQVLTDPPLSSLKPLFACLLGQAAPPWGPTFQSSWSWVAPGKHRGPLWASATPVEGRESQSQPLAGKGEPPGRPSAQRLACS